jgi:hypothetical protein
MSKSDEIAELRAELAKVKARIAPEPIDPAEAARWQDQMHRLREAQASRMSSFSREDIAAFEAACPPSVASDIVRRGAIPGPSAAGAGGTISSVPAGPGQNGWINPRPIGPPPGVAQADRLMDAADRRDREELVMAEARRKAALKLAGE